jgi:tetratricopeptide (TPR) repeat protein
MILEWFKSREIAELGTLLADKFVLPRQLRSITQNAAAEPSQNMALLEFLQQVDAEVQRLRLNFFKRAKLANSFKWRLLEKGVPRETADQATKELVLHLSCSPQDSKPDQAMAGRSLDRPVPRNARGLLLLGNRHFAQRENAEAITAYQSVIELDPGHAEAFSNLGSALCKLDCFKAAEAHFRKAIELKPDYPDAYCNFGTALRVLGRNAESETMLRCALRLKRNYLEARSSLGSTLVALGRIREAKGCFAKVLKASPCSLEALMGMGQVAKYQGHFADAEKLFKRVLAIRPKMPTAWAALAGLRKMTSSDYDWIAGAEETVESSAITLLERMDLSYAIGKFYDDVSNFQKAFHAYKRANELQKSIAEPYQRDAYRDLVDDFIRVYTPKTVSPSGHGSISDKPVFIVGMMRSGTSLAEAILASHPSVQSIGESPFWIDAVHGHQAIRHGTLSNELKENLAQAYLRALGSLSGDARRIIDKTPANADYLGTIHSVFPNARIIYMRRDPRDTCLSCYFQQFSSAHGFAMDMSDLAYYYRQHQRLMAHWRCVLPPGTILDVPYAELVADQEKWTRKILEFLGLGWDERCLHFEQTMRPVATASFWQVRQKMYNNSVQRWRNYEKFIGPLRSLDLDS